MVRLVDDLLDVARITRGRVELQRSVIALADVVGQAVETASPLFEHKRQRLEVEIEPGLEVHADPVRLAQVVSNLLTNASKFSDAGRRVRVQARRDPADDSQVLVVVEDEGIGMTSGEIEVVFGTFVQGRSQELHRPHGGLGLGLAIARSLAELHGGSLRAQSGGPGLGSRLELRLPLHVSGATVQPLNVADLGGEAKPAVCRRVLVVDDNEDAAMMLSQLLGTVGHRSFVAHDGPAALQLLEHEPVDVVVLDIGLPVMDGYELAGRIRARNDGGEIRLIALTGYGQAEDRERSRVHGIDRHLVKPVDVEELLRLVA